MAELHFTQNLRRHTPCPSARVAATTVAKLFERYFADHPSLRGFILDDQGHVRKHIKVLVDGRNLVDRRQLSDALQSDTKVHVFQALSGG